MTEQQIKVNFKAYDSLDELGKSNHDLCLEAVKALKNSHSPYSKFKVGAALRLKSGKIVYGSNQENVAYPSGLCAERVALFTWGANYPDDPIEVMAVTAQTDAFEIEKPAACCGSCLQVLAECEHKQGTPIQVILFCSNGIAWEMNGVQSFLPFLFFEDKLQS